MQDKELLNSLKDIFAGDKKKIIIGATIAIIVVIIILVVFFKFKDIKDLIVDKAANQKLVDEANKTINIEDISIPQDQFHVYAEKLYKAMKGLGTDEDAIFDVFNQLNSRSDVQQLIKTFGVKNGQTLSEWLYDDLDSADIEHINAILASKSINYKF